MSRVVKSIAVVDSRAYARQPQPDVEPVWALPVIKGGMLAGRATVPKSLPPTPCADSYREELGRLLVEIDDAKCKLKELQREIGEAKKILEEPLPDEVYTDTTLYEARKKELSQLAADARKEVDKILTDAGAEAERMRGEAMEEGYQEGLAKGCEEAAKAYREENEPKVRELVHLISHLSDYEQERLADNEKEIAALTTAVARKILCRELKTGQDAVVDMLRQTVERNHREEYLRVTLSPDMLPTDVAASQEIRDRIQELHPGIITAVEKELPQGSCLVETLGGITDLSVETQLENILVTLNEPN